jgi:hypothetical protein
MMMMLKMISYGVEVGVSIKKGVNVKSYSVDT